MIKKRNKPIFIRQGWDRYKRLGSKVKSKRKWRAAKGGDSKTRLKEKGRPIRPTIGWGSSNEVRNKVQGYEQVYVLNIQDLKQIKDNKKQAILIGRVGEKKKIEIVKKAEEMKIKILNRYKK